MNFEDFQLLEDRHHEEYSSEMMRIFRLKHTPKTITLQVTEDCCLQCKYCLGGETPILMADYTTKPIKDIQINDEIIVQAGHTKYESKKMKIFQWRK